MDTIFSSFKGFRRVFHVWTDCRSSFPHSFFFPPLDNKEQFLTSKNGAHKICSDAELVCCSRRSYRPAARGGSEYVSGCLSPAEDHRGPQNWVRRKSYCRSLLIPRLILQSRLCCTGPFFCTIARRTIPRGVKGLLPVSYTHLTLPTNSRV